MLSYRDMTFCPYWKDCNSAYMCHRPLTWKVSETAKACGMPLSIYAEKPECWSLKETNDADNRVN